MHATLFSFFISEGLKEHANVLGCKNGFLHVCESEAALVAENKGISLVEFWKNPLTKR